MLLLRHSMPSFHNTRKVVFSDDMARILLIRYGDFFYYLHQMAILLHSAGHHIDVLVVSEQCVEPLYQPLVNDVQSRGITCFFLDRKKASVFRRLLYKLRRIDILNISRRLLREAKIAITDGCYDWMISFDIYALYLAARLAPNNLEKIIDYSLEAYDESHPKYSINREFRSLVKHERAVLAQLGGLIIQDPFRERLLTTKAKGYDQLRTTYFPVSVAGPACQDVEKKKHDCPTVLFFGGLWSQTLVHEIEKCASAMAGRARFVVRGGRGSLEISSVSTPNMSIDTTPIPFDDLDSSLIGADIGLALYFDTDNNSRTTAYSSEKIARYCKLGIPFVAFDNPDYRHLQNRHRCCELISRTSELPAAIDKIIEAIDCYRDAAIRVFEDVFCLEKSSQSIIRRFSSDRQLNRD